jgi:hypothetical protein
MVAVPTTADRLLHLFKLQMINWNTDYYENGNKRFKLELVDFGFFPNRQNRG